LPGEFLPEIKNTAQAFGALYVIEGSTLGGQIIKKMVQKQLCMEGNNGLSFFDGYREATSDMWQVFKGAYYQSHSKNPSTGWQRSIMELISNQFIADFKKIALI